MNGEDKKNIESDPSARNAAWLAGLKERVDVALMNARLYLSPKSLAEAASPLKTFADNMKKEFLTEEECKNIEKTFEKYDYCISMVVKHPYKREARNLDQAVLKNMFDGGTLNRDGKPAVEHSAIGSSNYFLAPCSPPESLTRRVLLEKGKNSLEDIYATIIDNEKYREWFFKTKDRADL